MSTFLLASSALLLGVVVGFAVCALMTVASQADDANGDGD